MVESSVLTKVFGILEATAGPTDARPLAELAAEVGLAKPTAHRILKTLVALGYMERLDGGVYRQTRQVKRLASADDDRRLVKLAERSLRELWEATGETVNLGVLRLGRVAYLSVLESRQSLRRSVVPGMTDPFASTALGRAIAAHLPDDRVNYLLRTTPLEKRTPHTVVAPAALKKVFAAAREQGFATEENETDLGVMCIGAAVSDRSGVVAAVSVSAPIARAEPHRLKWVQLIRRTADRITARLKDTKGD
jgi:IclR family transcriptional regulator, KDG regulon repressor